MKKILFSAALLTALIACTGTTQTGKTEDNDSLSAVNNDTIDGDENTDGEDPAEGEIAKVPYLSVVGSDGLPPVFLLDEEEGNPRVVYWAEIEANEYSGEEFKVQDMLRKHLKDYTIAVTDQRKLNVRFKSELLPKENSDDWSQGIVTGTLGSIRKAGATYEFASEADRHGAMTDDWLPSLILCTKTFVDEHPLLPLKALERNEEGELPTLPSAIVKRLEEQYSAKSTHSQTGYKIGSKYSYGVIQFEPQEDQKVLALEVLTDGQDIWTEEHWGNCEEGMDFSVWNVDDGGEYFISHVITAVESKDGTPILFFHRGAPESLAIGWMSVKDGKLVRSELTMYYIYVG